MEQYLEYMHAQVNTDALTRVGNTTAYLERQKVIESAIKELHASIAIPCTACRYCVEHCPMKIQIPSMFALYNAEKQERSDKPFTIQRVYYNNLVKNSGKASQCIHCKNCEKHCPQHIVINEWMTKIAQTFEG